MFLKHFADYVSGILTGYHYRPQRRCVRHFTRHFGSHCSATAAVQPVCGGDLIQPVHKIKQTLKTTTLPSKATVFSLFSK